MNKQLEVLIAKIKKQTESFDTVVLKEGEANALIAALEQVQQQSEVSELLLDKVKRLESDIWDSQQLVKVKSENQYELECKVRELEERNDKSNTAWSRREDAALEKLEAAEKRIAELKASPLAVKLPESFYPDGDIDCPKVVEVEEVIEAIRAAGGTVEG